MLESELEILKIVGIILFSCILIVLIVAGIFFFAFLKQIKDTLSTIYQIKNRLNKAQEKIRDSHSNLEDLSSATNEYLSVLSVRTIELLNNMPDYTNSPPNTQPNENSKELVPPKNLKDQ